MEKIDKFGLLEVEKKWLEYVSVYVTYLIKNQRIEEAENLRKEWFTK